MRRVAVVGAAGLVGTAVLPGLAEEYELVLLDRRRDRSRGIAGLDARRVSRLAREIRGCAAVLDLAADARWDAPWDSVLATNIPIAQAVLEAAVSAGVPRVVQASSNQVAAGYERDEPYAAVVAGRTDALAPSDVPRLSVAAPPRPVSAYGAGKVFGEAACQWYAATHGLSTVSLRIGTVLRPDQPRRERHFATWLSHRDLQGLCRAAVEAPVEPSAVTAWAVSDNTWAIWDVEETAERLGYHPVDDAEVWRP